MHLFCLFSPPFYSLHLALFENLLSVHVYNNNGYESRKSIHHLIELNES